VQSEFRVDARNEPGATIIAISGELDLASSPALEEALRRALASGPELVVVDLRELEFMDSTGLSVIVKAQQATRRAGRRMCLVKGPPQVQRLLSLTGVAERIELVEAPGEAIAGG
jgi:anti-sigma B factor antagonist